MEARNLMPCPKQELHRNEPSRPETQNNQHNIGTRRRHVFDPKIWMVHRWDVSGRYITLLEHRGNKRLRRHFDIPHTPEARCSQHEVMDADIEQALRTADINLFSLLHRMLEVQVCSETYMTEINHGGGRED